MLNTSSSYLERGKYSKRLKSLEMKKSEQVTKKARARPTVAPSIRIKYAKRATKARDCQLKFPLVSHWAAAGSGCGGHLLV